MREVVLDIETVPCSPREWKNLVSKAPSLKKKFRGEAALDWATGRIVCIGLLFMEGANEEEVCLARAEEAGLLAEFWKAIRRDDRIIGHNVLGFDLPYIQARSVVCKVEPSRGFDLRRYSTGPVYDTMQVWANWERQKFPKLETLAAIFELDGKKGSGEQVVKWFDAGDWEKIKDYCMQDVRLTRDVYRRLKQYGL